MINESLNTIQDWEWQTISEKNGQATFESSTGIDYVVFIASTGAYYFLGFDTVQALDGGLLGEFTQEGKAAEILSTVIDIVEDYVARYPNQAKELVFISRSEEKSRVRAYEALLRRYAKKHEWDFSVTRMGSFVQFSISRGKRPH